MPTHFFGPPPPDPNVNYNGKVLPKDKAPYSPPVTSPDVAYDGKIFPRDGKQFVPLALDQSNLPSLVILGTSTAVGQMNLDGAPPVTGLSFSTGSNSSTGVVLPADVKLSAEVQKIIAETTILDGVPVTEHIRRGPVQIEFEFTIRAKSGQDYIFGQDFLDALFTNIIYPDTIIYVQNTALNKIGISQLICRHGAFDTVRGNINIPMTIKFIENVVGQSLIIN